jgi:hypothetical protein
MLIVVPASPFDPESGDQPRGGGKPEKDHGRESAHAQVTQAGQGGPTFSIARRTQKVTKSVTLTLRNLSVLSTFNPCFFLNSTR